MTERWRRSNYGTMQIAVTIGERKAYTRPFSIRVTRRLMTDGKLDADLIKFACQRARTGSSSTADRTTNFARRDECGEAGIQPHASPAIV